MAACQHMGYGWQPANIWVWHAAIIHIKLLVFELSERAGAECNLGYAIGQFYISIEWSERVQQSLKTLW